MKIDKDKYLSIKDAATGHRSSLNERYGKLYIKSDMSEKVEKEKDKLFKSYIAVMICTLLVMAGYAAGQHDMLSHVEFDGRHAVSIERAEDETVEMRLDVGMLDDGEIKRRSVDLRIAPSRIDDENSIRIADDGPLTVDELLSEVSSSVEDSPAKKIPLPDTLSDGTPIMWFSHKNFTWLLIIIGGAALLGIIYMARFDHVKKEEEDARRSITMELPGFINRLVLLLNGGLVLSEAFERAVADDRKDSYFHSQLSCILENSDLSNTPIEQQIGEYARNTGVREFIRVAGIIKDNIEKGTSLVDKLEAESSMLWFNRKKKAEELGRLAETRLTFPLMILLLILIIVTIAPALLEM